MALKLKEEIYSNTYGTHIYVRLLPGNKRIGEINVYITESGLTDRTSADNNPDFPKSEIRCGLSKRFMSYIDPQGRRPQAAAGASPAAGCRWSSGKQCWSWRCAEDGGRWRRGTKSMSRIRSKYGSTAFRRSGESDALSV